MRTSSLLLSFIAVLMATSTNCQNVLAADSIFSNDLFPDDKGKPLFQDFDAGQPSIMASKPKVDPEEVKRQRKAMVERADEQMRTQMQKVASWLQEFGMRNQHRFPGVYGDSNTIGRASQVQLTQLVGANPYSGVDSDIQQQEINGLSPGLSQYYSKGSPNSAGPYARDEWNAEFTAQNAGRIALQYDGSLTQSTMDSFKNEPPSSWEAEPGTITAYGNGQGYIAVWGAGIDGKPIKDYNGKVFILSSDSGKYGDDMGYEDVGGY